MIVPATPAAGSPAPVGPLVTPAFYSRVTGGGTCAQSDLDEAVGMVEEHLTRTLAYGTYTERLYVDRRGMVYPTATPLNGAATITPASSLVQGAGIWVGYFTPLPDLPVWTGVVPPQADVTYSGGYQPVGTTGAVTPELPHRLARAICKVAWFVLNPATLAGLPGGATGTNVAGVSISGSAGLSSMVLADPDLARDLARYRRRDARAW